MRRVLISGYFGMGNIGDEAILSSLIQVLKELGSASGVDLHIRVLSGDPSYTESIHGVEALDRWNLIQIIHGLANTQIFITGPGGLIQDATSLRSLLYYLSIASTAKFLRKTNLMIGCGIGPLQTKRARFLVRKFFPHFQAISVRDIGSIELLRCCGVTRNDIVLSPDLGFIFQGASPSKGREILISQGVIGDGPLIIMAPRPSHIKGLDRLLASVADELIFKYNAELVFLPFHKGVDEAFCRSIQLNMARRSFLINSIHDPKEVKALVGQAELLIGMRLHSLVFASTYGIPLVGISYDPKVSKFLSQIGVNSFTTIEELSEEQLLANIDEVMSRRPGLNYDIHEVKRLRDKAWDTAWNLLEPWISQ
jgi:polysaccharide pyruvyl transferase CsaB